MLSWLFGPRKPQVWLVCDDCMWCKVVTHERPHVVNEWSLIGPFRSEVDAEESADRMNRNRLNIDMHGYDGEPIDIDEEDE